MHRGNLNVSTRDVIKGDIEANWSELNLHPCHMHGLNYLSTNCLQDMCFNGLDIISINVFPRDIRGLQKSYVSCLKIIPVNIFYGDVR